MLPRRPLTNIDLSHYAIDVLRVPFFRGVFMRDSLPISGPHYNESAIINLDTIHGAGTHWVAYKKRGHSVTYYDSFGNLPPPTELVKYFSKRSGKRCKIHYNYERQQNFNTVWCGHLCLKFLSSNLTSSSGK